MWIPSSFVLCPVLLTIFFLAPEPLVAFIVIPSAPPETILHERSTRVWRIRSRSNIELPTAALSLDPQVRYSLLVPPLYSTKGGVEDEEEQDEVQGNPYADPNYPDLEFVNYADPEYASDRGYGDEGEDYYYDNTSTEEEIERMREERRKQNDEYQFQSYFADILKHGDTFHGEWTVYKSSSFLPHIGTDVNGLPRLVKAAHPLKVQSRAYKIQVPASSKGNEKEEEERIIHEEVLVPLDSSTDPYQSWQNDLDVDNGFGSHDDRVDNDEATTTSASKDVEAEAAIAKEVLVPYWPNQLEMLDFRGPQGIMCVGNAYTIATAVPLIVEKAAMGSADSTKNDTSSSPISGPYREYRAELGIQSKALRFRIKLQYEISPSFEVPSTTVQQPPPLLLKTLVVCREARELWPRRSSSPDKSSSSSYKSVAEKKWFETGLFGSPGAPGGLYDPPPIDTEQAQQYMVLDLEGQATVLFPYQMDQAQDAFGGNGWVSSLDWTPDHQRYQVDRKVNGGKDILGLRTLELSEVQSKDAERYRPRDGGQNMRQ